MPNLKFIYARQTLACFAAISMAFAAPVMGQTALPVSSSFVEDTGGSQRINFSGKLRMLSQRIPAAACNLHAGVAPQDSQAVLYGAIAEFDRILLALESGDDDLGVYGAEERSRTLRIIKELHIRFDPLKAAITEADTDIPSDAALQALADNNGSVLEMAKLLVTELTGQYADPVALSQSDALTIDIAGRQRMLTQRVSKDVCLTMSGVNTDAAQTALPKTIAIFEASLGALRHGMDQVGIKPPPTDEIADGLDTVYGDWHAIKGHLDSIVSGEPLSEEMRATVFLGLNKTMGNMNKVVGLYSEASQLGL